MDALTQNETNRKSMTVVNSKGKVRPRKYKTKFSENFKRLRGSTKAPSLSNVSDQGMSDGATPFSGEPPPENSCEMEEIVYVDVEGPSTSYVVSDQGSNGATPFLGESRPENSHEIEEIVFEDASLIAEDNIHDTVIPEDERSNHSDDDVQINKESEDIQCEENLNKTSLVAEILQQLERENQWTDNVNNDEEDQEQSDEEDEDDVEFTSGDQPIQPGHHLTVTTSVLLIWIYVITHSLTSTQLSDLLSLINIHLLITNPALKSVHHFKKFFSQLRTPMKKHYFCMNCYGSVNSEDTVCRNAVCGQNLKGKKSTDFFIELDIKEQLTNLFSRPDLRSGLHNRTTRIKKNENNIEDVYDSLMYKNLSKDWESLEDANTSNLTFTLNTDGVPIFKSSNTSVWPVFLMINELPYKMRKLRDNMILCGLWYGHDKPVMNLFLNPLHKCLDEFQHGVEIQIGNEKILVKAYLFCLSCDTPARSAVLNMNQHNGDSSCPKCLQTGVNIRTAKGGNIRVFPFQTDGPNKPDRLADKMKEDAETASREQTTIQGIKGPSVLMFTPSFDAVKNIGIDYMHLLYLGIVRLLLKLWFTVSFNTEEFSLYGVVDIVDSRIQDLKPSHFITRSPRTITDHLKFWKAAEVRSWFLYYSVPCVMDLLKPIYLYHYCALVEAIFLLSKASISNEDITRSEKLLNYFVLMFSSLYDERYLTLNMHCLLHLPQTVRELGPLWSYSCFSFEGANGDLLKMFHGTQYIDSQIVNAVHVFQMLPSLALKTDKSSSAYKFIQSMIKTVKHYEPNSLYLCGKGYTKDVDDAFWAKLCEYVHSPIEKVRYHNRAVIRGIIYHSMDYTRVTRRNSFTVKYVNTEGSVSFGFIQSFACVQTLGEDYKVAILKRLTRCEMDIFDGHFEHVEPDEYVKANFMNIKIPHLHVVQESVHTEIIPISDIMDLCICISCEKCMVVCEEPNHHELNL